MLGVVAARTVYRGDIGWIACAGAAVGAAPLAAAGRAGGDIGWVACAGGAAGAVPLAAAGAAAAVGGAGGAVAAGRCGGAADGAQAASATPSARASPRLRVAARPMGRRVGIVVPPVACK